MNAPALMALHIDALFLLDADDRLLAINEPDPPPAPRLYLGRTHSTNTWRFHHDLSDEIVRDLDPFLRAEPISTDLTQPPRCLPILQSILSRHAPVAETATGPAWHFPERIPAPSNDVIAITLTNADLIRPIFPTLAADLPLRLPCMAILHDGRLASLCFSSRNTPLAAEAGLETLEPFRGRGYAASVAAAWARAVRAEGRTPLYSTAWDNLPSRAVARKLGLILYGADLTIA